MKSSTLLAGVNKESCGRRRKQATVEIFNPSLFPLFLLSTFPLPLCSTSTSLTRCEFEDSRQNIRHPRHEGRLSDLFIQNYSTNPVARHRRTRDNVSSTWDPSRNDRVQVSHGKTSPNVITNHSLRWHCFARRSYLKTKRVREPFQISNPYQQSRDRKNGKR